MFRIQRSHRLASNFFKPVQLIKRSWSDAPSFIHQVFNDYILKEVACPTQRQGINIRREWLLLTYKEAQANTQETSQVQALIKSIPMHLSLETKLSWLAEQFTKHPAMPVITMHPTFIASLEAMHALTDITDQLVAFETNRAAIANEAEFKQKLTHLIIAWESMTIVPKETLTPQQEAQFALAIYKRILSTFPKFRQEVVSLFIEQHGGSVALVLEQLSPSIKLSFQNVFSWCMADFDGNNKRTQETMSITLPAQQKAILELYIEQLESILALLAHDSPQIEKLKDMHEYFSRCVKSIDSDIYFTLEKSKKTKKTSQLTLSQLALCYKKNNDFAIEKKIMALHDLIELAGFYGGLKEYVRQTTQLNQRVLTEFLSLLCLHEPSIKRLMNNRVYSDLSLIEKQKIIKLLSTEPQYFKILKQHEASFSDETKQEMGRLAFVRAQKGSFPFYITSDTDKEKDIAAEVLILSSFASYLVGALRMGDVRVHAFNTLPLCETPKDVEGFIEIARAMFDDPLIRNKMIESGIFSYVGGPSDLGKKGGLFVYVLLLQKYNQICELLNEYQLKYPELAHVKIRLLHGSGGDLKRKNGSSANELHSTQQGQEAWRVLAGTASYSSFLHRVMGQPSENDFRAQEVMRLQINEPKAYEVLELIKGKCVKDFEAFIEGPSNKRLLLALTSVELEKKLNITSRAGAKINWDDPTAVRAIGVVNLYLIAGIQWDVFMSLKGLVNFHDNTAEQLPLLFNELTVIKDIVYKVLFTLAVSDFSNAWAIVNHGEQPVAKQLAIWDSLYQEGGPVISQLENQVTLAHIEMSAMRILAQVIKFFPIEKQEKAQDYLVEAQVQRLPMNQMARGLMSALETNALTSIAKETDELSPHYQVLLKTVADFKERPSTDNTLNAIQACRGIPLAAGAPFIGRHVKSPLREETRLANANNLVEEAVIDSRCRY